MRQITKHIFKRIERDIAKDKRDPNMYWDAQNLKIINNGSNLSLKTHEGTRSTVLFNELRFLADNSIQVDCSNVGVNYLLTAYNSSVNDQVGAYDDAHIVGTEQIFSDLLIVVVFKNSVNTITVFFKLNDSEELSIVYYAPLKMLYDRAIDIIFNYETEHTAKIYWIDGINQLRHLNLNDEAVINTPRESVDVRGDITLEEIHRSEFVSSGDLLNKGTYQYCYILYTPSGGETGISPITMPLPISGTNEHLESDTVSGRIEIKFNIPSITYTSYKLFRIFYSEGLAGVGAMEPSVYMIADGYVSESISYSDTQIISPVEITMAELLNYGSSRYIPKYFNTDQNRLLIANYDMKQFDVEYDSRSYSFPKNSNTTTIYDDKNDASTGLLINSTSNSTYEDVPLGFNCVKNVDDKYENVFCAYSSDSSIISSTGFIGYGSTGLNIQLKLLYVTENFHTEYNSDKHNRSFKQREIYRIGIKYFNEYGEETPIHWVTDLYIPTFKYDNEAAQYPPIIRLQMEFTNNFAKDRATAQGITSYQLYSVERGVADSTIVAQGYIVPLANRGASDGSIGGVAPAPFIGLTPSSAYPLSGINISDSSGHIYDTDKDLLAFYSPDVDFNVIDYRKCKINPVGLSDCNLTDRRFPSGVTTVNDSFSNPYPTWIVQDLNEADFLTGPSAYGGGCPSTGIIDGLTLNAPSSSAVSAFQNSRIVFGKSYPSYKTCKAKIYDDASTTTNHPVEIEYIDLQEDIIKLDNENTGSMVFNSDTVSRYMTKDFNTGSCDLYVQSSSFLALNFIGSDWAENAGIDYSKFFYPITSVAPTNGVPVVELVRELTNQYKGDSYEIKQTNEYKPISDVYKIHDDSIAYGDVYIQEFNKFRTGLFGSYTPAKTIPHTWDSIILESGVNLLAREDYTYLHGFSEYAITKGSACATPAAAGFHYGLEPVSLPEYFNLRGVFAVHPGIKSYAKPYNYNIVENYKLSILITEKKHNNEESDSWLKFLEDETMSLDARYGEITGLVKHTSRVVAFQERAVSSILVSPTAQQAVNTGAGDLDIVLGEGNPLHKYTYMTTESGTLHSRSITSSKSMLLYFDYYNNCISVLATGTEGNELSTMLGLHTYFIDYLSYSNLYIGYNNLMFGCNSWYNNENELVYFTFNSSYLDGFTLRDSSMTISYSLLNKGFISWHDFKPFGYAKNSKTNYLYKKNSLEAFDDSVVTVFDIDTITDRTVVQRITILNSSKDWSIKRYDNVEFSPIIKDNYSDPSFSTLQVWNSYQDTGEVQFTPSIKMRKHRSTVPRDSGVMDRIRDDHSYFKFEYTDPNKIQLDAMYVAYDLPIINKNNFTENQVK